MQEYYFLFAIAGVLAAGAMSPGPSFFVVARNSLSRSRADGIATSVGTALGVALFAVLAGFGVVAILATMPRLFWFLKLIGGIYLLWIATKIWRGASDAINTEQSQCPTSVKGGMWNSFLQGLTVQTSNPKTAIVIAGIFAAFVPATPPPFTVPLVAVTAFVIDFSWYAVVALVLSNPRSRKVYESAKAVFDRAAAFFLFLVAARLVLSDAL